MKKRTIGIVTVARSDIGIYLPLMKLIKNSSFLDLKLIVAGMHFSSEFGLTYKYIEEQGFNIDERVEMTMSSDSPESIAKSIGLGIISFGQLFSKWKPDILLVLGDRYEMLSSVIAAMPLGIPIAHLHGGEATEGLIDEPIRHSITKMSHIHFVSTKEYYNRVVQLGEENWRVNLVGAPSLDYIKNFKEWPLKKLETVIKLSLKKPTILVTLHPLTLDYSNTEKHIDILIDAISELKIQAVFTYPNSDTAGRIIIDKINDFTSKNDFTSAVSNFGQNGYFTMLKNACAMVGNSSSGIIESASFKLPVLNIGYRQQGRVQASNVLNVDYDKKMIKDGIKKITNEKFKKRLAKIVNPNGDGFASERILKKLSDVELNKELIIKKFNNLVF